MSAEAIPGVIRGLEPFANLVPTPEPAVFSPVTPPEQASFTPPEATICGQPASFEPSITRSQSQQSSETGLESHGLHIVGFMDGFPVVQYPNGQRKVIIPDEPKDEAATGIVDKGRKGGHVYLAWDDDKLDKVQTSSSGAPEFVIQGLLGLTGVLERMIGPSAPATQSSVAQPMSAINRHELMGGSTAQMLMEKPEGDIEPGIDEEELADESPEAQVEPWGLRLPNAKQRRFIKGLAITAIGLYGWQKSYGLISGGGNLFTVDGWHMSHLLENPVHDWQDGVDKARAVAHVLSLGQFF